ncbi:hypothetical protein JRI60_27485 [Archangium violaceum]|uniref:beta-ketoacyl synthase N-terminal-like domain-containing protein n=1 Tax=Archangium violaceum TaxID=83451 RepID=UPI001950209A|nr:beta-ketoacyl synthase N-terminal-like domain-containing protein [Archangium violaceum]QRN92952.1 hypothetical protein JRI60_27485 [Archangium violaceum]
MTGTPPGVAVVGAAAVSAFGVGWRGLGGAVLAGKPLRSTTHALAATHPGVEAAEVPPFAPSQDAGDGRQRKLMSRGARLAAVVMREALRDAHWSEGHEEIGAFLGVGASGGTMDELTAMLRASIEGGTLSMERFGREGLAACNPLFAFQLMNNFTLCHGAILEGVGGPNGAFFSRGAGTVRALREGLATVASGECERALAGGADSALHPVTWAELGREGFTGRGLVPGEGAGLLALSSRREEPALAHVERCEVIPMERLSGALAGAHGPVDAVLTAAWGPMLAGTLGSEAARLGIQVFDTVRVLGEALAASPALAWAAAVDLLVGGRARRVQVLSLGVDGEVGLVELVGVAP